MAVDLAQIIPPLTTAKIDFILIGGMAAILHGSARVTFDVDLVYSRTPQTSSASQMHWRRTNRICARHRRACRLNGTLEQFATA